MNLTERDKKHLWHPLTQHQTAADPIAIVKAKEALLWDENGNEFIDAIASWYTAMYGHCNEHIIAAVSQQLQQLDQIVFTGFTHEPAVQLSESLMAILPENQQKIFFNDNGSTAVEAGIKMALQYHYNKGKKRNTLIAFENGFHGDTFGAMSVSGLSVYNGPFEEYFLNVLRIPTPNEDNLEAVLAILKRYIAENECAAFVYEPLVQGAAGMKMYPANGLEEILKICKINDVITIADEVMTGFGKTGKHFASLHLETYPDVICLSKALTAGVAAMSITSCTQRMYDAFLGEGIQNAFFHAHTYSANPLACAAAIAAIKLLTSEEIQHDIKRISEKHYTFLKRVFAHEKVRDARMHGVIFAIDLDVEMERYGDLRNQLFRHFMDAGVFIRPLGNTIYLVPPYVITNNQLEKVYQTIEDALEIV